MTRSPVVCASVWGYVCHVLNGGSCSCCAFLESVFAHLASICHKANYINSFFSLMLCHLGAANPGTDHPAPASQCLETEGSARVCASLHTTLPTPKRTLTHQASVSRAPNQPVPGARQRETTSTAQSQLHAGAQPGRAFPVEAPVEALPSPVSAS